MGSRNFSITCPHTVCICSNSYFAFYSRQCCQTFSFMQIGPYETDNLKLPICFELYSLRFDAYSNTKLLKFSNTAMDRKFRSCTIVFENLSFHNPSNCLMRWRIPYQFWFIIRSRYRMNSVLLPQTPTHVFLSRRRSHLPLFS